MILYIRGQTKRFLPLYVSMIFSALQYQVTYNTTISFAIMLPSLLHSFFHACKNKEDAVWLLFILAYDFWGIVPWLSVGSGVLHWYDLNAVLAVLLFFIHLPKYRWYKYGIVYIVLLIFIIIACFRSYTIYGQSVLTTILTSRALLVIIAFWPIVAFIKGGWISKQSLLELFEHFVHYTMVIYWTSWILVNLGFNITFLQTGVRWGTRIYINPIFLMLYFFISLYQVIYSRDISRRNSVWKCVISVLTIVVIAQGRSAILYLVIAAGIMLLVSNKIRQIIKYGLIAIIIAGVLMSVPAIRTTVIESLLEAQDTTSSDSTLASRIISRTYFEDKLKGYEVLGVGIPNNHNAGSVAYSGKYIDISTQKYNYYYLEDLGAFLIRYEFGIIAYVLYFVFLIVSIISRFRIRSLSPFAFCGITFMLYQLLNSALSAYITYRPFGFMMAVIFLEIAEKSDYEVLYETYGCRRKLYRRKVNT